MKSFQKEIVNVYPVKNAIVTERTFNCRNKIDHRPSHVRKSYKYVFSELSH